MDETRLVLIRMPAHNMLWREGEFLFSRVWRVMTQRPRYQTLASPPQGRFLRLAAVAQRRSLQLNSPRFCDFPDSNLERVV